MLSCQSRQGMFSKGTGLRRYDGNCSFSPPIFVQRDSIDLRTIESPDRIFIDNC